MVFIKRSLRAGLVDHGQAFQQIQRASQRRVVDHRCFGLPLPAHPGVRLDAGAFATRRSNTAGAGASAGSWTTGVSGSRSRLTPESGSTLAPSRRSRTSSASLKRARRAARFVAAAGLVEERPAPAKSSALGGSLKASPK